MIEFWPRCKAFRMLDEIKNTRASLWISASAGTGKTKNLIDRILSLLLNGAEPSHILCLTYTKAAAGEMLDRLSEYLDHWQKLSDQEVINELAELGFSEKYLPRVRELYKKSLESDWVNIRTIHSFGMNLLKKFPLETGLYPGAKLCEDHQKKQMLEDAFNFVLKQKEFHDDLKNIAQYTSSILDLIKDNTIIRVRKFFDKHGDYESIRNFFVNEFEINQDLLDLDFQKALQKIKFKIFGKNFQNNLAKIAEILSFGSKTDQDKANYLKKSAKFGGDDFISAVLTKELTPIKNLCTKKIENTNVKSGLLDLQNNTLKYLEEKHRLIATKINISFFVVLNALIKKFIEYKTEQHLIDYDDVIISTLELLQNSLSWVFYKIDRNINHILVDEAQDTSPEQWEIILHLTSEFFAHEYSEKTIFVVGDEKQSIYSFQGANVELFEKMHKKFRRASLACKQKFYDVELNKSYRSDGNILKFVDKVFANDFENIKHDTVKNSADGVVEIVDLFEKSDDDSENELAKYVADFIEKSIKNRVAVKGGSRAARPEDFLILFRHRKIETMNLICDELKKRNIPVSGVDRVLLKNEIVVEDLLALAEFKNFPLNDLICACVLKSPIVGMSEEDLMQICLAREDKNLWPYILEREDIREKYPIADLQKYLDLDLSVADFFHFVLVDGLREKFLNRLGEKGMTALDEFLAVCENYQHQYSPNLCNFLRWFEKNDQTIKKDFVSSGGEVRIMTVHASKGLQAPFVILADAHFEPKSSNSIVADDNGRIFWNFDRKMITENVIGIINHNEEYREAEAQRLLYVALTRAESYLCILGENGARGIGKNCWYSKLKNCAVENFSREDQSLILGNYPIASESYEEKIPEQDVETPDWYYQKLPRPENISPGKNKTPQTEFGDCVHLLLKNIAVYQDSKTLLDFANSFELSVEEKSRAVSVAQSVFEKFPNLFDKNSRSEVTVFFENQEFRIDKIAKIDGEIWIIDFKTGVPQGKIPLEYKNQLINYRNIYKEIANVDAHTAILWTQNLELAKVA
ncbi:MAG: UvrD-helicase domain-containing protein [Alphaproteobacteria bacterium]|nr:UvrD-helicase domain-containing protein [Alphaproteobacteria bacterium]